ncbi:MAG: DUF5666 domain-containing protein [Terracidiphilus sp.]
MPRTLSLLFATAVTSFLLNGCGSSLMNSSNPVSPTGNTVPVSLTMTDDPPSGVSVLFFQVSLTSAGLASSSGSTVSLIGSNPIQIDVTRLQALAAFLSAANVPAGAYNSLSLTFANPQLVIFNGSDAAIASSCALGTVCQLTPTIDNSATVSFTSAPFPVTVSQNSPLGFLVDFHLNTIIQSDLSVNLGAANGVTVGQLPPVAPSQPPRFGFLEGTVESVNAGQNQFTVQTAWGKTFTIDSNTSTTYVDFPSSACSSPGIGCLSAGQSVQVEIASLQSDDTLLAAQVTYLQAENQQTVEGTIFTFSPSGMVLILHDSPVSSTALPLGGMAKVTFASNTAYSVDANGFTIPPGFVFAGFSNLWFGQTVKVNVVSGSLTGPSTGSTNGGWGPPPSLSFTTNSVQLEPGQMTGSIAAIASPNFTLDALFYPNCGSGVCPDIVAMIPFEVDTTSQTAYQGFDPESFSGLATGDTVSVNGWLFEGDNGILDPAISAPEILGQTITLHPSGVF